MCGDATIDQPWTRDDMSDERTADGYNAGYAEQLYEKDLRDRGFVPPSISDGIGNGPRLPAAPAA